MLLLNPVLSNTVHYASHGNQENDGWYSLANYLNGKGRGPADEYNEKGHGQCDANLTPHGA